jgi:hypothetical protein
MNPGKTEETIIANLQREIIGKSLTVHQFAQLTMFNDFQETYGEAADGMTCSLSSESAFASLRVEAKPKRQSGSYRSGSYGGEDPPVDIFPLPNLRGQGASITVNEAWKVWNSTLRDLDTDKWHKGLIAAKDLLKIQGHYSGWAGKWSRTYRCYREVGEDVNRRLANNDGMSAIEITGRLESIRLSIQSRTSTSIRWLVDGLRSAKGQEPFVERKHVIDISRWGPCDELNL